MTPNQEQFGEDIQAQELEARDKMAVNINNLISAHMRKSSDRGRLVETRLRERFAKQANEISQEVKALQVSQEQELDAFKTKALLNWHAQTLTNLMERYTFMIKMHGGEDATINSPEEMEGLVQLGENILSTKNMKDLLAESNKSALLDSVAIESSTRPDHLEVLKRMEASAVLSPEDWKIIVDHMLSTMKGNTSRLDKSVALQMMSQMTPQNRLEFMQKILKQDNEVGYDMIMQMFRAGFVTQVQVQSVLEERSKAEPTPVEAAHIHGLSAMIKDPKVIREKEKLNKQLSPYKRIFGHKNVAKELLTVEGVTGVLLAANGALTVFANVAANLGTGDVISAVANPGNVIGFAQLAGGAQLSGGFGGLTRTPMQVGATLTRGKEARNKDVEARQNAVLEQMMMDLGNQPEYAEVYYRYADKIAGTYQKRVREGISHKKMSLEDMGMDAASVEAQAPGLKPNQIEAQCNEWARKFFSMGEGISRPSAEAQRNFIDEAYEKQTKQTMKSRLHL